MSWVIIPTLTPEEVVDRAHPLRVAAGQVVVDGDDVDAAAGERVEDRRQRRDEGLALAGAHLGDLALVEDGAADELDVEVAHAERPLHGLAGHRRRPRADLVEGLLEALVLALAARLGQLAAALEVGVVELVLGRLSGARGLRISSRISANCARISVVGQALELGLESVGLVDRAGSVSARGRSSQRNGRGTSWEREV